MNILIYQCLGSEIKLNDAMPLAEQQDKYELTQDNFIRNVRGFIRNEEGDILMIYDTRHQRRNVPGGKVDKGQTLEEGLKMEISEELGVKVKKARYIGGRKCLMRSTKGLNKRMAHYYNVEVEGIPYNNEPDNANEMHFLKLHYNPDGHLIAITVQDEIISDKNIIYDRFPGLHTLVDVLPHMPQTPTESELAPFSLPDHIDLEKTYQQWYNTETKEYFITEVK